jgi:hypothetical protein
VDFTKLDFKTQILSYRTLRSDLYNLHSRNLKPRDEIPHVHVSVSKQSKLLLYSMVVKILVECIFQFNFRSAHSKQLICIKSSKKTSTKNRKDLAEV